MAVPGELGAQGENGSGQSEQAGQRPTAPTVSRQRQAQTRARAAAAARASLPPTLRSPGPAVSLPSPASRRTRPAPSPPQSQSLRCLGWACQRCQPIPGARPISILPRAAAWLFQHLHSWPQASAKPAATAAGTSSGLSSSMALAIRPATVPQSALVLLPLSFSRASQSKAVDSWVPSSVIDVVPGHRQQRQQNHAGDEGAGAISRPQRPLQPAPRGTTRHDSKAGARRIVHSEGAGCAVSWRRSRGRSGCAGQVPC